MATFDLGRVTPLYKGDYNASTSYELNDVVLYNGNLYWHVQATATVGILPTDTTVWKLAFADEGVRAEIRGYADDAQASADSALASKSAAATSASNASASASQAASSAQTAQTAETNATASAQTASTKASEASTSAQSAASSAQTATDKATLASQKAAAASESATLATAKANAAATSETNAASSAQTATAKASEAAASATSAQEYDESAQASAVNAQTAQGLAETAQTAAETAQGLAEYAAESVSSSAAQIATNTDDIAQLKSDLSTLNTEGTVPTSEQMLSDNYTEDSVPYHFRRTASDNADREELEIVGGSVVWNQLAEVKDNPFTLFGVTVVTNTNGSITISGTATESRYASMPVASLLADATPNHVMMFSASLVSGAYSDNMFWFGDSNNMFSVASPTIKKPSTIGNKQLYIQIVSGTTYNAVIKLMVQDLTAMFGSTIADYIYSLEQTTAGAGVALFKSLFPNDYYEYNSGEVVSVSGLSAHVMRDVDNNIIRSYPLDSTLTLRGISKLVDGKMCFDGDTYDADGTVARKYGLVDLGTLNWGYSQVGTMNMFKAPFSLIKTTGYNNSSVFPLVCPKYSAVAFYDSSVYMGNSDKSIAYAPGSGNRFYIADSSYTSADDFKSAMSGVYLVYELATPTTETAEPYINPQICDPNGTEEFVSTGIVPVGHNTKYPDNLRMKLDNLPWNFASLIAPTESGFKATRNYTTGQLLIVNNVLYKATTNIANGGTITVGTNVIATTLAEVIAAL